MKKILFVSICAVALYSCKSDDTPTPTTPRLTIGNYDSTGFATATSMQYAVRKQLKSLVDETKKGRITGTGVNLGTLQSLYNSGNPSLKSVTNPSFDSKIQESMKNLSEASGGIYSPSATITGQGGVYGAYLFDEYGLEHEQIIEKGLFSAALYSHAVSLMSGTVTTTTVHQIVAISGMSPAFPNTDKAVGASASGGGTHTGSSTPDVYMAAYAARRDKNDGKGLYSELKNSLIYTQAAVKAGEKYKDSVATGLNRYKAAFEKTSAATVINYCIDAKSKFSKTNSTDAEKASALHSYGEAVGFISGWRAVDQNHRKINDSQIDEILNLLLTPYSGNSSAYKFITEPAIVVGNLQTVQDRLKAIYGFTDSEMIDFAKNWVNEQKR